MKLDVADNGIVTELSNKKVYKDSDEMFQAESRLLVQSDFVVAEIAQPSFGVGYAIKQALIQRKPVLCLYPDNLDSKAASEVFLGNDSTLLKIEFYNKNTLKQILVENIDVAQFYGLTKFNFLISQEIDDYLEWATMHKKKSKSEFLREAIVNKLISQDEEYQAYCRDKTKKG